MIDGLLAEKLRIGGQYGENAAVTVRARAKGVILHDIRLHVNSN